MLRHQPIARIAQQATAGARRGINGPQRLWRDPTVLLNQYRPLHSRSICTGYSKHWRPQLSSLSPLGRCQTRSVSGRPLPQRRSWTLNFLYRTSAWLGGSVVFVGVAVLGFFLFDASTYREDLSYRDIQVSEIALSPRRGGPKNLPIAEVQIDDDDCLEMQRQKDKPKLVILGGGWGSVALLKTLNPEDYHITLVSPTNYFLFTPMLPSATVGTLEFRSLVEPIRRIVMRVRGHFIRATAQDIEFSHKLVEVSQKDADGKEVRFYLPYDKLVIGVGSTTNPHGVKGLENCHFLKDIDDAQKIRNAIMTNLEYACLPTTPDEERRRLLSFVVSGGGPTGVEFAAELFLGEIPS